MDVHFYIQLNHFQGAYEVIKDYMHLQHILKG